MASIGFEHLHQQTTSELYRLLPSVIVSKYSASVCAFYSVNYTLNKKNIIEIMK
jgi:hypothetical protein